MAVGEIGMSLKDFYSLTFVEYHHVAKGYMFKDERKWDRMRTQSALLINVQLPKDQNILPHELIPLPSDIIIEKKKEIPTREDFERLVKEYSKNKQKD